MVEIQVAKVNVGCDEKHEQVMAISLDNELITNHNTTAISPSSEHKTTARSGRHIQAFLRMPGFHWGSTCSSSGELQN